MHLITNVTFPWAQKVCTVKLLYLLETDEEITEDIDKVSCKKCLDGLGEYYIIKILNPNVCMDFYVYDVSQAEEGLVSGSCTDIKDALRFPTLGLAKQAVTKIAGDNLVHDLFILKVSILPATE